MARPPSRMKNTPIRATTRAPDGACSRRMDGARSGSGSQPGSGPPSRRGLMARDDMTYPSAGVGGRGTGAGEECAFPGPRPPCPGPRLLLRDRLAGRPLLGLLERVLGAEHVEE